MTTMYMCFGICPRVFLWIMNDVMHVLLLLVVLLLLSITVMYHSLTLISYLWWLLVVVNDCSERCVGDTVSEAFIITTVIYEILY